MVFEALKEGEELPDVEVDAAGEQDDRDESEDDHRRSDQLVTRTITPHFNGFVSVLFAINLHFSSTQCLQLKSLKSQQLVGQKGHPFFHSQSTTWTRSDQGGPPTRGLLLPDSGHFYLSTTVTTATATASFQPTARKLPNFLFP